jgi:hypothetical protein
MLCVCCVCCKHTEVVLCSSCSAGTLCGDQHLIMWNNIGFGARGTNRSIYNATLWMVCMSCAGCCLGFVEKRAG